MKKVGRVRGSEEASAPLIVNVDTVYVHTNVEEITVEDEGRDPYTIFEYDEVQYTKDEYIQLMAEQNEQYATDIDDLILIIADIIGVDPDAE